MEILIQDECICNAYIKQVIEDVFVEFPALHLAVIVPTELVPSVHTAHVLIVGDNGFWARNGDASTILLMSEHCASC